MTWLQARQTLSTQTSPTLQSVQTALKQPLDNVEWQTITDYARQNWQATPHDSTDNGASAGHSQSGFFTSRRTNFGCAGSTKYSADLQPAFRADHRKRQKPLNPAWSVLVALLIAFALIWLVI